MTGALLLALQLTVGGLQLAAEPDPKPTANRQLAGYVQSLETMRNLIEANQLEAAKTEAAAWKDAEITWSGGTMRADGTLLDAVAALKRPDHQIVRRLETTIAELRASGALYAKPPDRKALQQVAAEQDVPELVPGGEVPTKIKAEVPFLEQIANVIEAVYDWLDEMIGRILDWLLDLFPRSTIAQPGATAGMRNLVIAAVLLIVLLIILLAVRAKRSPKLATIVEASLPRGSKRDEDPLSRGATEWERYAAQLAAAGRFREAIRAWYHAVLVTCYSAGILHFRKGRTNWEYVSALAPSLPWRAEMIQLTRSFERQWYGADESTEEALDECSRRARSILESIRRHAQTGAAA